MLQKIVWAAIKGLIRLRFPDVQHITTRDLVTIFNQDQPLLLLDARTASEYEVSHLKGSHLVPEPLEQLKQWAGVTDSTAIVVYCSIGYRSAIITKRLKQLGYLQVFNWNGSLFEWVMKGYPVDQDNQTVQQIHPYNTIWKYWLKRAIPNYKIAGWVHPTHHLMTRS